MKRLLTTLVILTGLLGSGGAVWADARSDLAKGGAAYDAGDYAEAVKWWRKAAEQGDAEAQYNLGYMYGNGWGVTQDFAEALKWYRKAAEQGDARAQYELEWAEAKVAASSTQSADAKREQEERQADARSDLAKGGAASAAGDYAEAVKWWRKAAEQGNAQAQHNLGLMYDKGEGVTQDYAEAAKWFRKAAEQGDVEAQYNLGLMYYFGDGVLQDTIAAHMWSHIAADNGHMNAGKSRDLAAGKLSSSDIMKAQQKAYLCMASLREKVSNYKECD
jgi:TPR repeat protein